MFKTFRKAGASLPGCRCRRRRRRPSSPSCGSARAACGRGCCCDAVHRRHRRLRGAAVQHDGARGRPAGQGAAGRSCGRAARAARWRCWPACWWPASCWPALQALFKYQGVFGNFPMRLRWNFHRLMLEQSMGFYQDEFAGRIATKVMQTALAVRDTWLIFTDILVYVVIYFVTHAGGGGRLRRLAGAALPGLAGAVRADAVVLRAAAGQGGAGAGRRALADDRAASPTPTPTSPPSSCSRTRTARRSFARGAMQEFMVTAYGQMRLVTAFEIVNQALSVLLIAGTAALSAAAVDAGPGRRRRGGRGHGDGLAAERHLALGDVGDGRRCSSTSAPCRTAWPRCRGRARWSTRPARSR